MVRHPEHTVLFVTHSAPATLRQNARPYINFEAQVDWHQRHEILKCACGPRCIDPLDLETNSQTQLRYLSISIATLPRMRPLSDMSSARLTRIPLGTLPSSKFVAIRYELSPQPLDGELKWAKFADLSEFGYGVAILSESKYGFSCHGNVLRISLLRGATEPDAEQDQGIRGPKS